MKLEPLDFENEYIKIKPIQKGHINGLVEAGCFQEIWNFWPNFVDGSPNSVENYINWTIEQNEKQNWIVHTIFDNQNKYVGQSCYMALRFEHLSIEIGGTWYSPKFWGTKINPSAKHALLAHGFLNGARRIELKTDDRNLKSQAAMRKMGAKFEGVFRNHMVRHDNSARHTHYFSIIDSEWQEVSERLLQRISD